MRIWRDGNFHPFVQCIWYKRPVKIHAQRIGIQFYSNIISSTGIYYFIMVKFIPFST